MSEAYLGEIAEQPGILARLATSFAGAYAAPLTEVAAHLQAGDFDRVLITAMGGSLHGAYPAYLELSRRLAVPVLFWDASELTQQAPEVMSARSLVIAISQSGESGELRRLTESLLRPALAISVTNGTDNSLARWADIAIATHAGPENTASTKTYTAGVAALHLALAHLFGEGAKAATEVTAAALDVQNLIDRLAKETADAAAFLGHEEPLVFIGRGIGFASAAMAALLTQEAAKLASQSLSAGQFRHGPLEMVRANFRAVIYLGTGPTRDLTIPLVKQITRLGGKSVVIGFGTMPNFDPAFVQAITLPETVDGLLAIHEILPVQYLVIPLAIARGFEPAAFLNASKITTGQ
ncbi:MAG: SIS domain-containing protein [Paracoccaceae bacterium]